MRSLEQKNTVTENPSVSEFDNIMYRTEEKNPVNMKIEKYELINMNKREKINRKTK